MAKTSVARQQLIEAAAKLFRRKGYAASGLNYIVEESHTPKGSLYHYFPDGKEQLALEVLAYAGERALRTMRSLYDPGAEPGHVLIAYGELVSGWMAKSRFRDGCPVATALLELAATHTAVASVGVKVFDSWSEVFATSLVQRGVSRERAQRLASVAISAFEGALIQSRVNKSDKPIRDAATVMAETFRHAARESIAAA